MIADTTTSAPPFQRPEPSSTHLSTSTPPSSYWRCSPPTCCLLSLRTLTHTSPHYAHPPRLRRPRFIPSPSILTACQYPYAFTIPSFTVIFLSPSAAQLPPSLLCDERRPAAAHTPCPLHGQGLCRLPRLLDAVLPPSALPRKTPPTASFSPPFHRTCSLPPPAGCC